MENVGNSFSSRSISIVQNNNCEDVCPATKTVLLLNKEGGCV